MLPFSDVCDIMMDGDDFMKKLSLILALIMACTVLFASCSKITGDGTDDATGDSQVESTTERVLTAEEKKELESVEKLVYNLVMAETYEEVEACVMQYDDEYGEYIIEEFAENDYIVEAEKLVDYKNTVAYYFFVTRENDEEYCWDGAQLFTYTDEGDLLINLDDDLLLDFCKEYGCEECEHQGYVFVEAQTSGGYDEWLICDVCYGTGFDLSDDKVTE